MCVLGALSTLSSDANAVPTFGHVVEGPASADADSTQLGNGKLLFYRLDGSIASDEDETALVEFFQAEGITAAPARYSAPYDHLTFAIEDAVIVDVVTQTRFEDLLEARGLMSEYESMIPATDVNTFGPHPGGIGLDPRGDVGDGDGVTIAIVDNGIGNRGDDQVPGFSGTVLPAIWEGAESGATCWGDHGTPVASVAAGPEGIGVAPAADLIPVVSASTCDGLHSPNAAFVGAMRAIDAGARVVNMSLGRLFYDPIVPNAADGEWRDRCAAFLLGELVDRADQSGAVVIVSAANQGRRVDAPDGAEEWPYVFPGGCGGVNADVASFRNAFIGVVATDDQGGVLPDDVLGFGCSSNPSNSGNQFQIAAPGHPHLALNESGGWGCMTSTSGATPHVAGVAALVIAANPDLTSREVKRILLDSAVESPNILCRQVCGAGIVSAQAAVALARNPVAEPGQATPLSSPLGLVGVRPTRLLDTREGAGIKVAAGSTTEVPMSVSGLGGRAVVLDLVAVRATAGGFLTAFPCGQRPQTSVLNYPAEADGFATAAGVTVGISDSDSVCIFSSEQTHLIVDLQGYFVPVEDPAASTLEDSPPFRALDTRQTGSGPTIAAGEVVELEFEANAGGATPSVVTFNLTSAKSTGGGFATAWDCSGSAPTASVLNFDAGQVVANQVTSAANSDGRVCIYVSEATDLLVDVTGLWSQGADGLSFVPIEPLRILDSRVGLDERGKLRVGESVSVEVPGVAVAGLAGTVTAVQTEGAGWTSVASCDQTQPTSSSNWTQSGQIVANGFQAVDAEAGLCLSGFAQAPGAPELPQPIAHTLVDITGWFV